MDAVALHLTKVAFGAESVEALAERLRVRGEEGPVFLTTRYLPKRHAEVAGQGSMYWILKHQLIARSPILGFGEAEGGRVAIHIDPKLVLVQARPKRAHQGWRYLEDADAPVDLGGAASGLADMPPALVGRLAELALI
ncbi:hypothetical protein ASE75_09505 [Sphingomonas sp. Leaf17]|uniref:DUF1489 family protein n=1 Tax=Sphingomonas sp. Leaf17 TaxID=1735683 RepID=UPI00070237C6|nr:DUF1489 domain-containing protein [Sphingomonas sp. Leaf17]KQM64223.1 hypothetical protein ASE75_09505 [Sphingomonas sp. Leaf17]